MGTRPIELNITTGYKDHPHAYGDKSEQPTKIAITGGSSPRVWGQVTRYLHMLKDSGIIPTRMGTSFLFKFNVFSL